MPIDMQADHFAEVEGSNFYSSGFTMGCSLCLGRGARRALYTFLLAGGLQYHLLAIPGTWINFVSSFLQESRELSGDISAAFMYRHRRDITHVEGIF
jgi:hypothetical protein